jgi:hypothetical protein
LLQREVNPKATTTEVNYDDYYRKLLGIVKLEGDDPVWRKYSSLAQPQFTTMTESQLRKQADELWRNKL